MGVDRFLIAGCFAVAGIASFVAGLRESALNSVGGGFLVAAFVGVFPDTDLRTVEDALFFCGVGITILVGTHPRIREFRRRVADLTIRCLSALGRKLNAVREDLCEKVPGRS